MGSNKLGTGVVGLKRKHRVMFVLRHVWKARGELIFDGELRRPQTVWRNAELDWRDYWVAKGKFDEGAEAIRVGPGLSTVRLNCTLTGVLRTVPADVVSS